MKIPYKPRQDHRTTRVNIGEFRDAARFPLTCTIRMHFARATRALRRAETGSSDSTKQTKSENCTRKRTGSNTAK